MGRTRNHKSRTTKNKSYSKRHATCNRRRDIDQIQDDIKGIENGKDMEFSIEASDDLPGLGQFYCVQCARHFADDATLQGHKLSKLHKRRLKDLLQPQYSKAEAERAAGKTKEVLPPASSIRAKMELA